MINYWLAVPATLAGLAWSTFCVWYWIRATWWKSQIGQNVMILGLLLAFTFSRAAYYLWTNPMPNVSVNQQISGILIYLTATAIAVQRTYLMNDAQNHPPIHNRRIDDPKDVPEDAPNDGAKHW